MDRLENWEDLGKHIEDIKRKLKNFRMRSPVFFRFSVLPVGITVRVENYEPFTIPLDYSLDSKSQVSLVKDHLRENFYPRMKKTEVKRIEPSSFNMKKLMEEENISFEEAFDRLSKKVVVTEYVIDKVDTAMNRLVIIDNLGYHERYRVEIPVIVFLKQLKGFEDEGKRWDLFELHCTKDERVSL